MGAYEELLSHLLLSKKGDEVPLITELSNTSRVIVFDATTDKVSGILKENLNLTGASGTSSKIPVTIDLDGQSVYNIASKPDNVDLVIGRVQQYQNIDYTYVPSTGVLTITNASVASNIKTNTLFDLRGYQNFFSKKEVLVIPIVGQTTYTLADTPNNISLSLNRTILYEGTDYTYNNTTGLITITNTSFINQITLNSILEARKIF